ncbi:eukaryotic translation initiation factor 4B3 [Diospyros lotus]|uniref:eukaryotic translation initiation factor 4B3 n=1 Tax=Diospyros lotus TaxID=55363 RepID=UPI00225B8250|nr:eukaryotic translation initiation factor 4B3 [Diospyros lotus]
MAATVTSAWSSKPGAWALDSEEHEAELLQSQNNKDPVDTHANGGDSADFPSLAAATAATATKTKKKKSQAIPLYEFAKPTQSTQSRGLTSEDLMMLPTGPRQRTAEELDRSRLGGGFRSFGYDRNNNNHNRYDGDESSNSRWGNSRVSDETRRFSRDSSRELAPSRADEVDDWGSTKKPLVGSGFERRERGFFGSESKADESESWVSNKSFVPSEGRRFDGPRERRVGFESSGGADSDNWVKKKEEEGRRLGAFDSPRERRGVFDSAANGGADSDTWGKKREEGSGSGRPRLNLQPRTLRVGDVQQNGSVISAKPKSSNPFGEARPREEVLKEKGQDWKEIDEKLESLKFKEMSSGTDGLTFGKRSFGSGNGRNAIPEERAERSWRKPGTADSLAASGDEVESGIATEAEGVVQE